jgi:hypothetical protein
MRRKKHASLVVQKPIFPNTSLYYDIEIRDAKKHRAGHCRWQKDGLMNRGYF